MLPCKERTGKKQRSCPQLRATWTPRPRLSPNASMQPGGFSGRWPEVGRECHSRSTWMNPKRWTSRWRWEARTLAWGWWWRCRGPWNPGGCAGTPDWSPALLCARLPGPRFRSTERPGKAPVRSPDRISRTGPREHTARIKSNPSVTGTCFTSTHLHIQTSDAEDRSGRRACVPKVAGALLLYPWARCKISRFR